MVPTTVIVYLNSIIATNANFNYIRTTFINRWGRENMLRASNKHCKYNALSGFVDKKETSH